MDLLAAAGFAVETIPPAHGRAVVACPPDGAPPFQVGRYATRDLVRVGAPSQAPSGWVSWLVDAEGHPLALAHAERRAVALLFRPESLLSEAPALAWLRRAIGFAGD